MDRGALFFFRPAMIPTRYGLKEILKMKNDPTKKYDYFFIVAGVLSIINAVFPPNVFTALLLLGVGCYGLISVFLQICKRGW